MGARTMPPSVAAMVVAAVEHERERTRQIIMTKLNDAAVTHPADTDTARMRAQVLRGAYERLILDLAASLPDHGGEP